MCCFYKWRCILLRQTNRSLASNATKLSLGSEDDGDPDNPVRVACREVVGKYGIDVVAAACNKEPKMSTIMVPAVDNLVIVVGGLECNLFTRHKLLICDIFSSICYVFGIWMNASSVVASPTLEVDPAHRPLVQHVGDYLPRHL